MKHSFYLFLLFLIFSCSSSQKKFKSEKCPKIYENDYTEILNKNRDTNYNKGTIKYNELRFECVRTAFYTYKIMFDKFGKWDNIIYINNNKRAPILIWEKVNLFSNGKKYNVYSNGVENRKQLYGSVMIFDENYNDLLSTESIEREKLTNYFASLIKDINFKKKGFSEEYWKMVDPKVLEYIENKQ